MAEEARNWDEPTVDDTKGSSSNDYGQRKGAYQLDDYEKLQAEMVAIKRQLEFKQAAHVQAATIQPSPPPATCPVCEIEGHGIDECPQLPLIKDTLWLNQRQGQGQWQQRPYEANQQYPRREGNSNNYVPPSGNFLGPPRPNQRNYVPPPFRNEHPDARLNTMEHGIRKAITDQGKSTDGYLEKMSKNMEGMSKDISGVNKNLTALNENIGNLVKLTNQGRLPAQPVHLMDNNQQGQSSNEHINAITELRSGKLLLKRGDELLQKEIFLKNQCQQDRPIAPFRVDPEDTRNFEKAQYRKDRSSLPSGVDPDFFGKNTKKQCVEDRSSTPSRIDPTSEDRSSTPLRIDPDDTIQHKINFSKIKSNTPTPFTMAPPRYF